ncbi:tetratricopeptide repeat protein [Candidatus Omnitrophota bacterium]
MLRKTYRLLLVTLVLASFCLCAASAETNKEEELFFVAQKSFEDGFYDVSLGYFERFLQEFPETTRRAEAYLMIAQCYLKQDRFIKSLENLQLALESPNNEAIKDSLLYWSAEVHFKGKDYSRAKEYYQQIIDSFPGSTFFGHAYYSLGWCFFEEAQWQKAAEHFQTVISAYPNDELIEDSYFKLAESKYNLKKFHDAKDAFAHYIEKFKDSKNLAKAYFYKAESSYYLEDYDSSIGGYLTAIDKSMNGELTVLAKTGLGWSYLKLSDFEKAENYFKEAEEQARSESINLDEVLFGQATLYSEVARHEDALTTFSYLITETPKTQWLVDAYLGKANALYALNRFDEAITTYKAVLEKFPSEDTFTEQHEKIGFGLAWSYLKLENLEQAIEVLKNIASKTTSNLVKVGALCQVGDAYHDAQQYEKALGVYDGVLQNYPDSFYGDYAQLQQAMTLLKMERFDAAILSLQALQKNFPESKSLAEANYYLGLAYFNKGNFVAARDHISDFNQTLSYESPLKSDTMLLLGASLRSLSKFQEAIDIFNAIKKDYPDSSDLMQKCDYEVAMCYFGMKNDDEALKMLKILVYKFPDSQAALDTLIFLGNYYSSIEDYEVARRHLQRVIAEFPYSDRVEEAKYRIAKLYVEEEQDQQARDLLTEITEHRPESKFTALAHLELAEMQLRIDKDFNKATETAQGVVEKYPDFSRDGYFKLADIQRSQGSFQEAVELYRKALDTKKVKSQIDNVQVQFAIAETFEEKGSYDEAIEVYFEVAYLYPEKKSWFIRSYLRAARIFEDREDWPEAQKIYEKISLENVEEAKFAQERLEWINQNIIQN